MTEIELTSDSEIDDPKKITDAASCLDYLKRKEVFLYKMMNDPSHKAMLYFLEVLMNSEGPVSVEQLAARFSHKTFSPEMRAACGGGSPEGLREFLSRYPSLFNVHANGHVDSVAIELTGLEGSLDGFTDIDGNPGFSSRGTFSSNEDDRSHTDGSLKFPDRLFESRPVIHRPNKNHTSYQPTAVMRKFKNKSISSLSLISSPSNNSSSSGSLPYYRKSEVKGSVNDGNENLAENTTPLTPRRGSNPALSSTNRCGIYQPPFRKLMNSNDNELVTSSKQCCDTSISGTLPILPTTACLHCHLIGLTCHHHHHCPLAHHHHHSSALTSAHCLCTEPAVSVPPCCQQFSSLSSATTTCHPSTGTSTHLSALPPMERLTLETGAVRFFQQRLFKREERWVPIKSLAGHLSQASAEVRAVVGPQLEFRNFLLKHPHVFEVQGELVSNRDPFGSIYPVRNRRDRFAGVHASISSINLSIAGMGNTTQTSEILKTNGNDRAPRPKSLILPNNVPFLSSVSSNDPSSLRPNFENRRSTHFAENFVTACYTVPNWPSRSGSTSSAPNTPTGHNSLTYPKLQGSDKSISKNNTASSNATSSFSELDTSKQLCDSLLNEPNSNSLSISMSANEYRSVMFVRKVVDKRGGAPGQTGLSLRDLMQIASVKAPETVQSTIGWTKIEFMEFLNKHPIFFEVFPTSFGTTLTPFSQSQSDDSDIVLVKNKRLEKMINIVITGSKLNEAEPRSLTNRCGRIFHVAKLWGIIDLGRHEHVFFDKSIFKHVDDLQKYFKVDELLYFNAVLAPKESRAKWRATQVWKECDREAMEKLNAVKSPSTLSFKNSNYRSSSTFTTDDNPQCARGGSVSRMNNGQSLDNVSTNENEDTEADEEIEDIVVDATSGLERPRTTSVHSQCDSQQDCEFALDGDEEVEEDQPFISELAYREGLHLINDIKFVGGELSLDSNVPRKVTSTQDDDNQQRNKLPQQPLDSDRIKSFSKMKLSLRVNGNSFDNDTKNNYVSSSTENTPSECASSHTSHNCSCDLSSKRDNTTSVSSNGSCSISIAVQTVSTGDIMATQLYHDLNQKSCKSERIQS